jgi:hypothetical protein
MKLREVERLRGIIKKGQQTNKVFDRIEMAKRGRITKELLRDVEVARKPSDEMIEYMRAEEEIYNKFGVKISTPNGNAFQIEDWAPVTDALKELRAKSKEVLDADKKAKEDIETLLDTEVDVEMEPMKNDWFGEFINGDDAEFLLEHDLLDLEESEEDDVESSPSRKRPSRRKGKRR